MLKVGLLFRLVRRPPARWGVHCATIDHEKGSASKGALGLPGPLTRVQDGPKWPVLGRIFVPRALEAQLNVFWTPDVQRGMLPG